MYEKAKQELNKTRKEWLNFSYGIAALDFNVTQYDLIRLRKLSKLYCEALARYEHLVMLYGTKHD